MAMWGPEAWSTRQRLILTAERLFARHGLHGVSLRQIGVEAGNGNSSAVQYHFGTKDDLVRAILLHRLPRLNERRAVLAGMASSGDVRSVMEAHLLPIVEHSEIPDSYYLTFVEHVLCFSTESDPFDALPVEYREPRESFIARVCSLLPDVPGPIATRRVVDATAMCLHASAVRERARREGSATMTLRSQAALLLDGLVGYVTAPVSEHARDSLEREMAGAITEGDGR